MKINPFKRLMKSADYSASSHKPKPNIRKSVLEENFSRLERVLDGSEKKAIAIIGQPGAGKSSLLLKLTNGQCTPKPVIGQGTDATDWSRDPQANLFYDYNGSLYIDTPGYDTLAHPLKGYRDYLPFDRFDVILFSVRGKIHGSDEEMFESILEKSRRTSSIVLIRSYSDDLTDEEKASIEQDFHLKFRYTRYNIPLIFVSNRYGEGIDELKKVLEHKNPAKDDLG
ncbi:GTPase [Peribacillus sp. B-H-3]|uniref:GTPase domain-containing protein n=1 Tax=Peribacillus sp. B-H-3 TaxID=3400420 RepID=UPI003B02507B